MITILNTIIIIIIIISITIININIIIIIILFINFHRFQTVVKDNTLGPNFTPCLPVYHPYERKMYHISISMMYTPLPEPQGREPRHSHPPPSQFLTSFKCTSNTSYFTVPAPLLVL